MMLQAPRHVPDELRELVERSTAEFEKVLRAELGTFAHVVNVQKWIDQYRDQATALALAAFDKGKAECASPV